MTDNGKINAHDAIILGRCLRVLEEHARNGLTNSERTRQSLLDYMRVQGLITED